jgi:hypothetical protein
MSIVLDLIGSAIVAGYVIFLGLRMNSTMSSTATASTTTVNIQEEMMNTTTILESDLKKIGYGLSDPTIAVAVADSNKIRFRADMNRDGTVDSVEWYVGNALAKYTDRDVRILYRKYNNQSATIAAVGVTTFRLKYLDQDGTQTSITTNIAMIEMTLALSSLYKVADQVNPDSVGYVTTLWRQGRLSTRNLTRHG